MYSRRKNGKKTIKAMDVKPIEMPVVKPEPELEPEPPQIAEPLPVANPKLVKKATKKPISLNPELPVRPVRRNSNGSDEDMITSDEYAINTNPEYNDPLPEKPANFDIPETKMVFGTTTNAKSKTVTPYFALNYTYSPNQENDMDDMPNIQINPAKRARKMKRGII